jgi:hypothetical protein
VLDSRNEMTGADRQWAAQYGEGTWCAIPVGVRFWGSTLANTREWIEWTPAKTVSPSSARTEAQQTYDPRRLSGVSVYTEVQREFSQGDRVQFTAPSKELQVANRELGTIEQVSHSGNLEIRMDSGREVRFNIREHPHLDHGYAVTSHSSQGQTADRVLIHVDTEKSELLVNNRFAYVSVSRAQHDAQIYTNDGSKLSRSLSRESSQRTATEVEQQPSVPKTEEMSARGMRSSEEKHGISMGIGTA